MPRLALLTKSEQQKYDASPQFNMGQRQKFFTLKDELKDYIENARKPVNRVGFLVQLAYFKASGKFFPNDGFKSADILFACEILDINPKEINISISSYPPRDKALHKKVILNLLGWKPFSPNILVELKKELMVYARQQLHPRSLFPISTQFLLGRNIELPPYYVLADIITDAYIETEKSLINIIDKALSPAGKDILDDIILIDDKRRKHYKYSCLAKIKQMSLSIKIANIIDSIETFKLIKEFYKQFSGVYELINLSESASQYYATWVKKSKLFQLKQFKNRSKAHLYLLAYMQHQYFTRNDMYVDIILKTISTTINSIKRKKEKERSTTLQAQTDVLKKISVSYKGSTQALHEVVTVLKDENINNDDDKVEEAKSILEDFLASKNKLSVEDKTKIENLLHSSSVKSGSKVSDLKSLASSLHRKLDPIIQIIEFDKATSNKNIVKAITKFSSPDSKNMYDKSWLTEEETAIAFNASNNKPHILIYKGLLFTKIYDYLKSGQLNLAFSYRCCPIEKYLIDKRRWFDSKSSILSTTGLDKYLNLQSIIDRLKTALDNNYVRINQGYIDGENKYLSFNKSNRLKVSTPGGKKINEDSPIESIFSKIGTIPITQILDLINQITQFTKSFKHHSNKRVKMRPSAEIIYAGILSKGCNHGLRKMANISKGITEDKLKNTLKWFFSIENIQSANNRIIAFLNNLTLPNIYKIDSRLSHTSSDGQKFNVSVDSILANYSFKYFGTDQGISVYSFIDSRQILFHDTVISPTEREAAYVIDGLMANDSIKSDIHSTDTHGYSEMVFAVTHLLGVSFAPRIKKIGAQKLYSIETTRKYTAKHFKIRPDHKINLALIVNHWDDILRFVATIKTKTTKASQLSKRLNSYTRDHPLYKAIKEFGRIIKSIYILTYVEDLSLRQQVDGQLNKIELSNKFSKAVFFANGQEFKVGAREDQILIVACKSFIQNCIVLWNYIYLSNEVINTKNEKSKNRLITMIKQNSVISWRHVNLHGEYDFTVANDRHYDFKFNLEEIIKLKIS